MLAVALLPPAAAVGMVPGAGNYQMARGALLLLGVNVVSVMPAARITFFILDVRPRTWWQKQKARQSLITCIVFRVVALLVMLVVIKVHHDHRPGAWRSWSSDGNDQAACARDRVNR